MKVYGRGVTYAGRGNVLQTAWKHRCLIKRRFIVTNSCRWSHWLNCGDICRISWAWQLLSTWTICGQRPTSIRSFMQTYVILWRQVHELQFTPPQHCLSWSEALRWALESRPPSKLLRFVVSAYPSRGALVLLNNTSSTLNKMTVVFATRLKVALKFASKTRLTV